jgi:uncharacterized protein (DUF1501 family)
VYGEAPNLSSLDGGGNMKYSVDYRSLYATALERWWQIDSREIVGGRYAPLGFLG